MPKPMRVIVTGKSGQVVTALKVVAESLNLEIITLGRPEADLAQPATLRDPILAVRPDVIISAAAFTAVDLAETEIDLAYKVNAEGPAELAKIAAELSIPIIHLSTDYVYDGAKSEPYVETDSTAPISVYGHTKLAGERAIISETPNHIILRTAWVYSPFGANFVKTMLRVSTSRDAVNVVDDQFGCPTSAMEIARAVIHIAMRVIDDDALELRGIFHLTAQGEASWAEFARSIFEGLKVRGGKNITVKFIPTREYPTPARRPANSRLNGQKLFSIYGIKLDSWQKSLDQCLDVLIDTKPTETLRDHS